MRLLRLLVSALQALVVVALGVSCHALAQATQTPAEPAEERCETCHGFEGMKTFRDGREIPLHVDFPAYAISAHADVLCLDCHVGIDQNRTPHADPIPAAVCSPCHQEEIDVFRSGLHAREASCTTCHQSIHTLQAHTSSARCTQCHSGARPALLESIHSPADMPFACATCHTPHNPEAGISDNCLACHGASGNLQAPAGFEAIRIPSIDAPGAHREDPGCGACHSGHSILPSSNSLSTLFRDSVATTCGSCHRGPMRGFSASTHGASLAAGHPYVPTCTNCHVEHHHEPPDDASEHWRENQYAAACKDCHLDNAEVAASLPLGPGFMRRYENSIHARERAAGNGSAPTCMSCHSAHRILGASHPDSRMHPENQPARCGRCHEGIDSLYAQSVHGMAVAYGFDEAPVCTTCHGDHGILEVSDPESPLSTLRVSEEVCGPCHSSIQMSEKFGFAADRLETFSESFHGKAGRLGSDEVANCVSCHGVHDIMSADNPASRIHPANLVETCGTCHPNANAGFVAGEIHISRSRDGNRLLYWISTIYLVLILCIIGLMVLHNGLDWGHKLREKIQRSRGIVPKTAPVGRSVSAGNTYSGTVRMTRSERLQHLSLMCSFLLLAITGFMLSYPDAFWVRWLAGLFGSSVSAIRGPLHRIAAVMLIGTTFYHIWYRMLTDRGKEFKRDIRLRFRDLGDVVAMLRHNLGRPTDRPEFGRFSYVEKIEYWSVVWGTALMTLTGIALWFESAFIGWFSKLFVDVSSVIHLMEAWLAILAILVWHLYAVMFDPDVAPMNVTWITGRRESGVESRESGS